MRYILTVFITGFLGLTALTQTTVKSTSFLVENRGEKYIWMINGKRFHPSLEPVEIYPHASGYDTIVFIDSLYHPEPDTIFTRIPVGREYTMMIGCCAASFDMYETSRVEIFMECLANDTSAYGSDSEGAYMDLKEAGRVVYEIVNLPPGDTLVATYTDFAGFPSGILITENKKYGPFGPSKGYYSTSNDFVVFARMKPGLEYISEGEKIEWYDPMFDDWFETLRKFRIRLFEGETILVRFDVKTGKYTIAFEEN